MNILGRLLLVFALLVSGVAEASPFAARHAKYTPPSADPAGIVANGLQAVYHLKSTNGPRVGTTNVSVYPSPPAGFSFSSGTLNTDVTGSGTVVSAINNLLKGGFYYSGNGTHTLTDAAITSNSGVTGAGYPLGTGVTSGNSVTGTTNVDVEHCSIDGSTMLVDTAFMINPKGAGTFKLGYCNVLNPPRDPYVTDGLGGTFVVDHDYFSAFCQSSDSNDHCEWLHFFSGTVTVSSSYFNATDGLFPPFGAGISGGFQVQTGLGTNPATYSGGAINFTMDHSIVDMAILNQYVFSGKAVFADVDIYVGSSVFNNGAHGLSTCLAQADLQVGSVVGTFTSGETITSPGGKSVGLSGALTGGNNLHLINWGSGSQIAIGNVVTGVSSGATATVTAASYHHCIIHDNGGNLDFSGNPAVLP